jgi:hypothetical protein
METTVIPKARRRKVLNLANVFLKAARAPNKPWTWMDRHELPSREVLDEYKNWQSKGELEDDSEDKFTLGPFIVHNVAGAEGKKLEGVRDLIKRTTDTIKKSRVPGIDTVLYGDILIVEKLGKPRVVGIYRPGDDKVYVRPIARIKHDHLHTVLHELGHRYWGRTLGKEIKREWRRHHDRLDSFGSGEGIVSPKAGDPLPFKIRGYKTPPKIERVQGDRVIFVNKKGGESFFSLMQVFKIQMKNRRMDAYPTPYASTDPEEHFCEALAMYMTGKLQGGHVEAFEEVMGIAKPEPEPVVEEAPEPVQEVEEIPTPPEPAPEPAKPQRAPRGPMWGVTALFGPNPRTDRYHVALFENFEEATDYVKEANQEGWKSVLVKRVSGPAALAKAQREADTFMDRIDDLQMY